MTKCNKKCNIILLNMIQSHVFINLLYDVIFFSQYLHVILLQSFLRVWIKNFDNNEKIIAHSRQLWYYCCCDKKLIIVCFKLIINAEKNENAFIMTILNVFNEMNLIWFLNHLRAKSRRHWKKKSICRFFDIWRRTRSNDAKNVR